VESVSHFVETTNAMGMKLARIVIMIVASVPRLVGMGLVVSKSRVSFAKQIVGNANHFVGIVSVMVMRLANLARKIVGGVSRFAEMINAIIMRLVNLARKIVGSVMFLQPVGMENVIMMKPVILVK
jgi:hypothetical protein